MAHIGKKNPQELFLVTEATATGTLSTIGPVYETVSVPFYILILLLNDNNASESMINHNKR